MAFLDAYRVTATLATSAMPSAPSGSSPSRAGTRTGGGVWWETLHRHKTSEPLAAEIYAGFDLYRLTGDAFYLATANKFLSWAEPDLVERDAHLYGRNDTTARCSTTSRG